MQLYLHIPFCESKCPYCAFTSLKKAGRERAYMAALARDLAHSIDKFKVREISTLFIGGGTPSVIPAELFGPIFDLITPLLAPDAELSCEANPSSASPEWLSGMRSLGINRLSLGAQSLIPEKLALLGRCHCPGQVLAAVEHAHRVGFKNINIDLIYDTKMDDKKMLQAELAELGKIRPLLSHLSAYALAIEPGTKFAASPQLKKNAPRLMSFFSRAIEELGLPQYEISNFGHPCRHNLAYWQGLEYLGCGFGSVGFVGGRRFYTASNLAGYLAGPLFRRQEDLSEAELALEHLFLGLRSCVGVDETRLDPAQKARALLATKGGRLRHEAGRFYARNYLLGDELALFILG